MAIWMEIRCDGRNEKGGPDGCWSHTNSGPQEMAHNTKGSVENFRRILLNEARDAGWQIKRHWFFCPVCAEARGLTANPRTQT
jgi:hypothetical protein